MNGVLNTGMLLSVFGDVVRQHEHWNDAVNVDEEAIPTNELFELY